MQQTLNQLIAQHKVLICCGSGGVGKTTVSAVIGLQAAIQGRNVVVITIDPAKRLATSLGLKELQSEVTDLTQTTSDALQISLKGKFFAVMPNTSQTFDKLIQDLAGQDQNLFHQVVQTSIYKMFTQDFSGTNEYMAMEKLYELLKDSRFDFIVLDTPPSSNTKSFLEAPRNFSEFFDEGLLKWILNPGGRLLSVGIKKVLSSLEHLTGKGFISELIEFSSALFQLRTQFLENLKAIQDLLHRSDVGFLLITSPERVSYKDTSDFVRFLSEGGYALRGFIVNRALSPRLNKKSIKNLDLKLTAADEQILNQAYQRIQSVLSKEKNMYSFLQTFGSFIEILPEQSSDVYSVNRLYKLSQSFIR